MALPTTSFHPWKSYLASHFPLITVTLRLMLLMHLANMSPQPAKGQMVTADLTVTRQSQYPWNHPTDIPRHRCKCHARSLKGASHSHTQDLALNGEISDEGLQYYLKLSAYISHNQKSSIESEPQHSGITINPYSRHGINSLRPPRQHNSGDMWDDISLDEDVHGQILLEHTWSSKWGVCRSHVCYETTCRRATLNVACVGPCTWYRRYRCPRRFGGFCVTSRDYEGCKRKQETDSRDKKFHIINGHGEDPEPKTRTSVDMNSDGSNDGHEMHGASDGSISVVVEEPIATGHGNGISNKYDGDGVSLITNTKSGKQMGRFHQKYSNSPPTFAAPVNTDLTLKPGVQDQQIIWKTQSANPLKDSSDNVNNLRRSDAITSGIRYIWVVSCIVVPTLIFCVGYAIAMHLRRKRFLQHSQHPRSNSEGASDPFLAAAAAPPYSVEDIYDCPRAEMIPPLNFPPPSYDIAMSATEIAASRERTRTISACSDYLMEQQVGCSAPLPPLIEPPPYEVIPSDAPNQTPIHGHHRLPSYDSAVCLNNIT